MSMIRKLSPTGLGVAVMLLGMLLFALNDAMGKWLVATYSQGQVILIRSAAALIILVPIVWRAGLSGLVRIERPGLQFARVFFSTAELFCFYFAVAALPLADVMTYWLAAPIYVAALSPFLLGEKWAGVAGLPSPSVLLAFSSRSNPVRQASPPQHCFRSSAAPHFAFMMLSGRQLRNTPDTVLAFWQIIGAALAGIVAVFLTPSGWLPVQSSFDLAFLGLLGVVAMTAHVLVNRALKLADAATVAPLQYTLLLWAVIFGWLFFGDVPQTSIVVGAGLIVLSGLYIFFRENTLKRRRETAEGLAVEQV